VFVLNAYSGLAFPSDLLENGNNFATVGCGFILFPGVFIALLHRFENSLKRGTNWYFYLTIAAYVSGYVTSIVMKVLYGLPPLFKKKCGTSQKYPLKISCDDVL